LAVTTAHVATGEGVYATNLVTGDVDPLAVPPRYGPTALSPDGSVLVYGLPTDLMVVPLDGGEPHTVSRQAAGAEPTDWSADGGRMLVVGSKGVTELDLDTGAVTELLAGNIQDAVWSPDEDRIAFVRDQRLGVLDVDTGEARDLAPELTAMYLPNMYSRGHLAWTPDGESIAVGDWTNEEPVTQGRSDIYLVDAESGDARRLTDSPRAKRYFAFSPDGRHLAYAHSQTEGEHLRIVEVETGQELAVDARQNISFAPAWRDEATVIVNDVDIVAVEVDGSQHVLVARQGRCYPTLFGYADDRIVFMTSCPEGL
jgi:Tol biopolymer transport system component